MADGQASQLCTTVQLTFWPTLLNSIKEAPPQTHIAVPALYDGAPDGTLVTPLQVSEVSQLVPGLDEKPDTLKTVTTGMRVHGMELSSHTPVTVFPPVSPMGE